MAGTDAAVDGPRAAIGRLRRHLAGRSARLLQQRVDPVTVFRLTGIMPYVEAPVAPELLRRLEEPPPFAEPAPDGAADGGWSRSRLRAGVMAHVAAVENGIALASGAVFDGHGRFCPLASHDHDFVDHPGRRGEGFAVEPHRLLPRIERRVGDLVVLTTSNHDFYFHWLFDVLPRLQLAEQEGFAAGPFYVRSALPFQRQSLELLGVDASRCVGGDRGAVSADRLIVPCHHILPGRVFPPWSIGFLRGRILPKAGHSERVGPRLYVSRAAAGHRRVQNEPELVDLLSRHGFEAVRLETLDFREQVALFRDARCIVAPHGGGLANLAFCRPGTQVIELFPAGNIDLYYRLAKALQLDYRFVKSREAGAGVAMGSVDYRISPDDLAAALLACGVAD